MKYLYWLHDHIIYCHASHKVKLGELHEAREPRKDMSNTGLDPEYETTVFSDVDVEKNSYFQVNTILFCSIDSVLVLDFPFLCQI